ncbi:MAG: glycosyltransferase, partial [Actinobacteria bacterium]|nr:glycosyltransferase [Actinomycetota bacterium]
MSSLRIAILSPYPWPPREDVNVHISALAKALCVLGHRVTVFAPGSDPAALADGRARRDALAEGDHDAFVADGGRPLVVLVGRARAISTRAPIASARDAAGALEVILADSPFDVVDVHEALAPSPLLPALRHARGIVIATFHGMAPPVGVAFASPIVSRALANVDIRIVATRAAAAALNELLPERYDVVPPAASVVPAPPTAGGILIVARDRDRAGMRFALRAIRDAGAADHAITILGPGDAPWRTTAAVPTALRARVLTIADRGADSKRSAISGAELVLIPGEADTDVGVLDDALASGRTVLAVRTPLAEERMSSGLLAPFSTPDWAAAISTALAAPRRPAAPARRDWSDVATARLTLIRAAMVERRGAARAPTTVLADLDIRPGRAADVPALIAAAEARSIGVVALVVA